MAGRKVVEVVVCLLLNVNSTDGLVHIGVVLFEPFDHAAEMGATALVDSI
jgi:hypothetical protein